VIAEPRLEDARWLAAQAEFTRAAEMLRQRYPQSPRVGVADTGFYAALWLGAYHPEYLAGLIRQYAAAHPPEVANWFAFLWDEFMALFPLDVR